MSTGFSSSLRNALYVWMLTAVLPATAADVASAAETAEAKAAETPPLSVRSLFHPEKRHDFDGPDLPETFWMGDADRSRLVMKRGERWIEFDLQAETQRPWTQRRPDRQGLQRRDDGLVLYHEDGDMHWITRDARSWHNPTLSPDGNRLAYVEAGDLYILDVASGRRVRVTSDGSETQLNGILDWSYQEELYGRGNFKAFWWSPGSDHLAFLRLDISRVYPYTLADSRTPRGDTLVTRYPKVGDPIPVAELWIADTQGHIKPIYQPAAEEREQLVVRVGWHPGGDRVVYQVMNRIQSWLELRLSEPVAGEVHTASPLVGQTLLREESTTWVEVLGEPHWLPGGGFYWLSDQPLGRRRVWYVSPDARLRVAVTPGDMDVREIVQVNADGRTLYVTGDRQRGSVGQQVYRVDVRGRSEDAESFETSIVPVTHQRGWHEPEFSPDGRWMLDRFSTLQTPPALRVFPLGDSARGKEQANETHESDETHQGDETHQVDRGNSSDREGSFPSRRIRPRVLIGPAEVTAATLPVRWLTIPTEDGFDLPAYLIRPPQERGRDDALTPVLIETYGGPQAPSAVDRYAGTRYLYRQMLAQQGIAVLVTDNRSSAGRGIADTWAIHRRVGEVELADTLAAVEWLRERPWVDPDAIALRGWSFGGFLTAYAMTHSTAFAAGVAGGAPTDWRNYDAIYTERYMGLPEDNAEGYERTSVSKAAKDLHGALLLIHGELDDNVHPANTLQLVRALQDAGKPFEMMLYPGAQHGVRDPAQVYHMMQMVTRFLRRHLISGPGRG
ncbi:S9 family peptidase [Roseimaritima sediminicola]|uniref:S9 family peptidase n=1 Tax=Roseimaritima sediminicola TaxID=2662066 RepID=UPI00138665D0|nr:DPP IV N-terminal domain-containing protein [Roseimaritima sediminicola]